jgi:3-deoxy-D-manno-octulosonic-acid transferase
MLRFWQLLYNAIALPALWVTFHLLSLFNSKVRRGVRGRSRLFDGLAADVANVGPGKRVWFHASSMGEFEQARPIIAELRRRHPGVRIIVTFFSPSGYEHARKHAVADVTSYLPFDTRAGAGKFLDLARPDAAVLVRYDVWPNHLWELRRRGIPAMIANATMRKQSPRLLPVARDFHHHVYDSLTHILTVSESDTRAFDAFSLTRPTVAAIGDTRFDQVSARSAEARQRHLIPEQVTKGRKVIVAGSTWGEDEAVLIPALRELLQRVPGLLSIVVPHEPTINHLDELESSLKEFTASIRFSALNEYAGQQVIVVDSIGILMVLYASAHLAYVGGSFRQGVHNILEAAVYGIPVLFGPKHWNSQESLQLLECGGAFVVTDPGDIIRAAHNLLTDESARTQAGSRAAEFVKANIGATQRFLAYLEPHLGLSRSAESTE